MPLNIIDDPLTLGAQVCTFAKSIPGFKCLHHDDQVCLLKSCIFEVLLVRLSGLFDNQVSLPLVPEICRVVLNHSANLERSSDFSTFCQKLVSVETIL